MKASIWGKVYIPVVLALMMFSTAEAVIGEPYGTSGDRIPLAVYDPATGERIVVIPRDWKSFYPFSERYAPIDMARDSDLLMDLRATRFMTDRLVSRGRNGWKTFASPDLSSFPAELVRQPFGLAPWDYFIVQSDSPAGQTALRKILDMAGVPILDYLPRFAYLVRMDEKTLRELSLVPSVHWIGFFQPAFRIDPKLDYICKVDPEHVLKLTVHFDGEYYPSVESILNALHPLDLELLDYDQNQRGWLIRLSGRVSEARRLAVLPGCLWVGRFVERRLHNNIARTSDDTATGRINPTTGAAVNGPIMDVEDVWDRGIRGEGQIAAAADTGLSKGDLTTVNNMHWDFGQKGSATNPLRVIKGYGLGRPGNWNDDETIGGGHGTHTSGSIVGNGIRSGSTPSTNTFPSTCYAGTAPKAGFVFQSVMRSNGDLGGLPTDLNYLFQPPYDDGARVHSNSWGAATDGEYDIDAQNLDLFCWAHKDMVITFSAGNDGTDGTYWNGSICASIPGGGPTDGVVDTDSIGSPGTAKNCITVGASENYRPNFVYQTSAGGTCSPAGSFNQRAWGWGWCFTVDPLLNDLMCNNACGIAAFSSRGPVDDGRFKPDLVAPGVAITSTRTNENAVYNDWGECEIPSEYQIHYVNMGGTSMSNPLTAGAATLVRQYYVDGWHGNNTVFTNSGPYSGYGFNPSSALVKATLINGAYDMTPGQYGTTAATKEIPPKWDSASPYFHDLPNNAEGFGRVDLEHSLFPGSGWQDDTNRALAVYDVSPGLNSPNYTDYTFYVSSNADPFIATLVWTDPYGAVSTSPELVNDLDLRVTAPGGAVYYPNRLNYTGGTADRTNNVEQVKVTSPASGNWTIRVTAYATPGNGESGSTTQPYALVISGVGCSTSNPSSATATLIGTSTVQVAWASVTGATEYRIYRSTVSHGPYTQIATDTASPYTDATVTVGSTYYYVVRAYAGCESRNSPEASITIPSGECNLPPVFSGLSSASTSGCGINLAWSAATAPCGGGITYSIYRSTTSGFTPSASNRIAEGVSGTSFLDSNGLTAGTTHYYVARAMDNGNGIEDGNTTQRSATPVNSLGDGTWAAGAEIGNPLLTLTSPWSISSIEKRTGTYSYRSANTTFYPDNTCADLRTPSITLTTGQSSTLTFYTMYDIESNYDGGVVEISTNGGTSWSALTVSPAYPEQFNRSNDACLYANRRAHFSGSSMTSWTSYTVNLSSYNGQSVIIRWNFSTDEAVNSFGWYIDDISITHAQIQCFSIPGDVQFLTARATSGQVKLEWVNPGTNYGGTTRICRKIGSYPTGPTDGYIADVSGSASTYSSYTDQDASLLNGITYYYAAYAKSSSGAYADGETITARPFSAPTDPAEVKWAYSTGATALAPPGVSPGAIGTGAVYAVSNDRSLYAIDASQTGGSWPRYTGPPAFNWEPYGCDAPAQDRPSVAPTSLIPGATRVAFLGSQDGCVHAVNARSGDLLWTSTNTGDEVIQASPAGMFVAFGGAYDLLFAGTRNATAVNRMIAFNPVNGNVAWQFDNGGGSNAIGIISGMPAVDYDHNLLFFTSRTRGGGSSNTVWCLHFTGSGPGDAHLEWSPSPSIVESIDAGPNLYNNRLYVGTNTGKVYALNALTGQILWSYDTGDGTPVKSYVSLSHTAPTQRIYFSTSNRVYALDENQTTNTVSLVTGWPITDIISPSNPLYLDISHLYVGAGDGKLYEINATASPTKKSITLGASTSAVGSASFDVVNNLIYVGTAAGIVYAVSVPFL